MLLCFSLSYFNTSVHTLTDDIVCDLFGISISALEGCLAL